MASVYALSRIADESHLHANRRQRGRLIQAGGQIYDTRRTPDESGIYVAGTFRRAINDSHTLGGDALALSFIALSDPYQKDGRSVRLAAPFLKDNPSVYSPRFCL